MLTNRVFRNSELHDEELHRLELVYKRTLRLLSLMDRSDDSLTEMIARTIIRIGTTQCDRSKIARIALKQTRDVLRILILQCERLG